MLTTLMVVLVAATAVLKTNAQDEDCDYQYIKQPPETDDVMCNPYLMASQLTLECELQIPESDLERANIRWFNGSEEITAGVSDPMTSVLPQPAISSTIIISYTDLDDRHVNDFSCVLELRGESWLPSDSLRLGDYNDYLQYTTCGVIDVYHKGDPKCAVDRSSSLPPAVTTTTTSNPTTSNLPTTTEPDTTTLANNPSPSSSSPLSPHTPTITPSPSPLTTLTTDRQPSTTPGGGDSGPGGGASPSGTLQVWIYVLVAVAAVFAMIIIILAIMCVGLCLRRSKTIDTNSLKQNGQPDQFSPSNTMVPNDMYNRCDLTMPSHSLSDYNTLGERDYEVVKSVFDTKEEHEYHRLQRPSPPNVPNGRTGMFGSPPGKEFQSMNTLTSQLGNGSSQSFRNGMRTASTLPLPPTPNSNEPPHVYGELEDTGKPSFGRNIYRSPTNSSPPDSARWFDRGDSAAELLPPGGNGSFRGASNSFDEVDHEALYSQVNDPLSSAANPMFVHALQDIPETGPVFKDPPNPTAFPVNEYDVIQAKKYETPVSLNRKPGDNPKSRVSVKSLNYETDPNLDLNKDDTDTNTNTTELSEKWNTTSLSRSSVPDSKVSTMTSIVSDEDTTDFTGASEVGFAVGVPNNEIFSSSTAVFPSGTSSMDQYRNTASTMSTNFTTATGDSDMCAPTSDTMSSTSTLPDNIEIKSQRNKNRSLSSSNSETRVTYPTNHHHTHSSSQTGYPHSAVVMSSEQLNSRARSLPPFSAPVNHHHYRELNVSGLEPQLHQYARLQIGITSTV